jgi:O-antigen ligase
MLAVQSVVAVAQFLAQRSLGMIFLGELALDPSWPGVSIVWAPGLVALRSYGLSDHPNILGGCLALGLLFLLAVYPGSRRDQRTPILGVIILGLVGLIFTFSRSAWLAFAAGALVLVTWAAFRDRAGFRALFVLGLTSALVLLPFFLAAAPFLGTRLGIAEEVRISDPEFQSPENRSLDERADLNQAANRMFVDNPITGVGVGVFPVALQQQAPDFGYDYQPAHFVLLLAAAETGLLGALFYFLAAAFPWVALWLARTERSVDLDLAAATAALAAVTVIGRFDYYPWFLAPGRLWLWLIWGFWAAFYEKRHRTHA